MNKEKVFHISFEMIVGTEITWHVCIQYLVLGVKLEPGNWTLLFYIFNFIADSRTELITIKERMLHVFTLNMRNPFVRIKHTRIINSNDIQAWKYQKHLVIGKICTNRMVFIYFCNFLLHTRVQKFDICQFGCFLNLFTMKMTRLLGLVKSYSS